MTDSQALERAYRRVLACYPRSFRRDNEDEILAVLLATAGEGQTRVGLAEAADLIRGVATVAFLMLTLSLLLTLAQDAVAFAPADMAAAAVEWALGLASVVLVFTPASCRYFRPPVAAARH
jgi:hypothetical protein